MVVDGELDDTRIGRGVIVALVVHADATLFRVTVRYEFNRQQLEVSRVYRGYPFRDQRARFVAGWDVVRLGIHAPADRIVSVAVTPAGSCDV